MTTAETLARCEALRSGEAEAGTAEVAWLVECFDHPLKVVQRRAGEALLALGAAGRPVGAALETAMRSGPFRRRWAAAWTAAQAPGGRTEASTAVLFEALGVDDGDVRWAAARILTSGETRASARLLDLAEGGNDEQRKMAVYCLRDLARRDDAAQARYRAALQDRAAGVRLAGLSAIQRVGRGGAADARAVAALLDDADGGVRRAAAATLGRMGVGDARVVRALRDAAASDDAVLARIAGAALNRLA